MRYSETALQSVREGRLLINRYDAWLSDEFRSFLGNRILEIGFGLGNLLEYLHDRELIVGIETSKDSVECIREKFNSYGNIHAYNLSINSPDVLQLKHFCFDTAISVNVFEHIEDDLLAMQQTWQLLLPGGKFILIVPSHSLLYGTMDRAIGHYRRYTKQSLQEKMIKCGFKVEKQKYINMLGGLGWWFNGRILKKEVPPSNQLRFFNVLVPVLKAFENLFDMPFGISLLTIGSKIDMI